MKLHRFWIEFQKDVEPPPGCRLGCGVTAFSREDALALVQEHVHEGAPLPGISRIQEDVDVSTLDQNHVIPNMGDVTRRGIWYPNGSWHIEQPIRIVQDALSYVRRYPERFLHPGRPLPVHLASWMLMEVLVLGGLEACVLRNDGWWLVGSDVDWLATGFDPREKIPSTREIFEGIISLPQAGQNEMRAEILLTAFCEGVVTIGPDGETLIRGEGLDLDFEAVRTVLRQRPGWNRVVAFWWPIRSS